MSLDLEQEISSHKLKAIVSQQLKNLTKPHNVTKDKPNECLSIAMVESLALSQNKEGATLPLALLTSRKSLRYVP